jgi:hypothetical protein
MTTYCGKKVKLNDPKLLETGISSFHHRYVADMDFAIHGWRGAFLVVWACLLRSMQGSWSRKMTRDDIIRLAREAHMHHMAWDDDYIEGTERFAALVAAAERERMKSEGWRQCAKGQRTTQYCGLLEDAVQAEREACAKACEKMADNIYSNSHEDSQPMPHAVAKFCAAAIRARGER